MAHQEHIDLLKQGTDAWNVWRSEHREIRPDLSGAKLSGADLNEADLSEADLRGAYLSRANLSRANLSRANLSRADLSEADLSEADLSEARIDGTVFGNVDLRPVKGLDTIQHHGPSYISTSTLVRSAKDIPEDFLRGAGLPDNFIE